MGFIKPSQRNGQSILEFMLLTVFIIGAFIVMAPFITRGISGRWKATGDSMGSGRLYDPNKTLECRHDFQFEANVWYNLDCFEETCDCYSVIRADDRPYRDGCRDCILSCRTPMCDE